MSSNLQQGGFGGRPGPAPSRYREIGVATEELVGTDGARVTVRPQFCVTADLAFGAPGGVAVLGAIPAGATIDSVTATVGMAFNAGTTNVLHVGTAASQDALVAGGAIDPTSATRQSVGIGPAVAPLAATTTYQVKYTQTGTAATAGAARVTIHYSVG